MEVTTIGQLPAYGTGVYDLCGPKIEFDDPTMQLPSSRARVSHNVVDQEAWPGDITQITTPINRQSSTSAACTNSSVHRTGQMMAFQKCSR